MKGLLVTGSHRSGTTWAGKMLATSPALGYIHEPFNRRIYRPGICSTKFDYLYPYITEKNEEKYYHQIQKIINFDYNLLAGLDCAKSPIDIGRVMRDYLIFQKYKLTKSQPLIKDPMALFSAEWLTSRFDIDVVVLIRHPAAFVSSLKVKKWYFPFEHFLKQPLLMRDCLNPFAEEIQEYSEQKRDIVEQGILLWKIIHTTIANWQKKYPNWIFVRHEDLSRQPISNFQKIFSQLDIDFSEKIKLVIEEHTKADNPSELTDIHSSSSTGKIKRNSSASIHSWKNRLTEEEIDHIRGNLWNISNIFYTNEDW